MSKLLKSQSQHHEHCPGRFYFHCIRYTSKKKKEKNIFPWFREQIMHTHSGRGPRFHWRLGRWRCVLNQFVAGNFFKLRLHGRYHTRVCYYEIRIQLYKTWSEKKRERNGDFPSDIRLNLVHGARPNNISKRNRRILKTGCVMPGICN